MHTSVSGVAHMSLQSEKDALDMVRHFLSYLPSNNVENPPFAKPADDPGYMDESLNCMVPIDPSEPYIMHQVIEKIVDPGSFLELQPGWARNAIIGLARMGGHSIGVVGQEPAIMAGVIDIDAADKMTRFVRMCDCFNVPLVTFVDSPGSFLASLRSMAALSVMARNCFTRIQKPQFLKFVSSRARLMEVHMW